MCLIGYKLQFESNPKRFFGSRMWAGTKRLSDAEIAKEWKKFQEKEMKDPIYEGVELVMIGFVQKELNRFLGEPIYWN